MSLLQGTMNVVEYTTKFKEIAMQVLDNLSREPDERWKCVKFEGGLCEEILESVGPMEIRDYAALVNKCCLVEDCNRKLSVARSKAYKKLALQG